MRAAPSGSPPEAQASSAPSLRAPPPSYAAGFGLQHPCLSPCLCCLWQLLKAPAKGDHEAEATARGAGSHRAVSSLSRSTKQAPALGLIFSAKGVSRLGVQPLCSKLETKGVRVHGER
jgi:hypothetical protein|mmetsp:Transcript_60827/g.100577  ORF Transcript_60827/g.100577 Transcript_60827/m.100577 type:complete len:118 (-) Transcript_60827:909-1262(-)